jgi:hypothetical protein
LKVLRRLFAPILTATLLLSLWSLKSILDRVAYGPVQGTPASIHMSLTCDPASPQRGQTITFILAIDNKGTKPVVVQFPGAGRYQMVAYLDATVVWSRTMQSAPNGIVAFTLAPGQGRFYQEKWDLKAGGALEPGTYTVRALFSGEWPGQRGNTDMEPLKLVIK